MDTATERFTPELNRLIFEHHDSCVMCGYMFKQADTTHQGYSSNGEPLYVCGNCSDALKETAARRYFFPRPYSVPEPGSILWRYMDFSKYVSLLSSKGLYFSRADCFDDIHEGAKGLRRRKDKWDSHYLDFFRQAIRIPPPGYSVNLSDDEVEKQAQKLLSDLEAGGRVDKKRTYVSCWHENEHESEAMWRLYSSFIENAVAVRTTFQRLYVSMGRDPFIRIGRVEYIDFNTSYAGPNDAFWRKRKSFQHEREVRAMLIHSRSEDRGKIVSCDMPQLIEGVFVSPKAPEWFIRVVNAVNEKFGLPVSVTRSALNEESFF